MNVVPLAHLFRTIQSLVNSTRWFLACATLVALLAAGAGVSATLLIAVVERTREIGVHRALGASSAGVFRLFWLETVQICLAGAILGVTTAFCLMRSVESWWMPDIGLRDQPNFSAERIDFARVVNRGENHYE